jgi:F-type H+-transporting ATPase subunit epsilon
MPPTLMTLSILLPFRIFANCPRVLRIIAETKDGSFGLLPHRRDCVAALAPGILIYQSEDQGEVPVAIDHGVLIKAGLNVMVSVRRAMTGGTLARLQQAVSDEFLKVDEQERNVRTVVEKLEAGIMHRFASLHHG